MSRSRTLARWLLVLVFAGSVCYLAGAIVDATVYYFGPASREPRIVCESPVCHLGRVRTEGKYSHDFVIRNTGGKPLAISSVKPGCSGCLEILGYPDAPIAPGDDAVVRLALNTSGLEGEVKRRALVTSNDPNRGDLVLMMVAQLGEPRRVTDAHPLPP